MSDFDDFTFADDGEEVLPGHDSTPMDTSDETGPGGTVPVAAPDDVLCECVAAGKRPVFHFAGPVKPYTAKKRTELIRAIDSAVIYALDTIDSSGAVHIDIREVQP